MDEHQSVDYWTRRWGQQGKATVGHAGSTDDEFRKQTELYGDAMQAGLGMDREYPQLLEVGCGWGRLVPYLMKARVVEYEGVDIAAPAIMQASRHGPHRVKFRLIAPGDFSCFPDERFDAVVACTVLQHIVDQSLFERTVQAMLRVVKKGGRVVLLENCSAMANKPHIAYRPIEVYQTAFAGAPLGVVGVITFKGEQHALLAGDRAA